MANEVAAQEPIKIVDDECRIDDVSFFFLNDTFSDLNLVVEGRRLPAHKVILSTRCKYFQLLLQQDPQQDEIQVADVTVDVFTNILRYIYTGEVSLKLDTNSVVDFIKIAHRYSLQNIQDGLTEKLSSLLTMDNVCTILNYSNGTDLERIREVCHRFMDQHILEFRGSDLLNSLTQQSMVKFLERDSLLFPEIEIFDLAQRWIKSNADTDKLVANCVRWSLLTKKEIYSIVRSSKVFDDSTLVNILYDLDMNGSRTARYRIGPNERYADQLAGDIRVTVEVLELPTMCLNKDSINSTVIKKGKSNMNLKNVCSLLNTANWYDLQLLQRACYSFMEKHSLDIVYNYDSLKTLTQESMVGLLSRETFVAPEVEIFRCATKWYSSNPNADDSVWNCVKFASMTIDELTTIIWPSRLVAPDKLFEAIEKITTEKNKLNRKPRSSSNINYAASTQRVQLFGTNAGWTEVNSRNVHNFLDHDINCGSGIIVRTRKPVYINHIRMMLREDDARYYSYKIEISVDKTNWKKVIDYSDVPCRGLQELYFDHQRAQYIKIVGTKASIGKTFEIEFFETYFRSSIPKTLNGIVCAAPNLIVPHKNVVVKKGYIWQPILRRNQFLIAHKMNDGGVVIQLSQPFVVSKVKFFLPVSRCRYYIETSMDEADWRVAVDCRNNDYTGKQEHYFEARSVVFIRITGTSQIEYDFGLICDGFECSYESQTP